MKRDEYILEGRIRVDEGGIYFVSNGKVFRISGVCVDVEREEMYWMCVMDNIGDLGV